jgi:DNA modification methylase
VTAAEVISGRADWAVECGDCLALLSALPDAWANAVVTDPPYGQSNEEYDRGVDPATWRECFRVAKPDAALLSFAGSPTYHRIALGIEAAGWKVRQMWAWIYRDGMITSAYPREGFDRLAPAMDPICFATKGKILLPLEREGEPWECWGGRTGEEYSGRSRAIPARTKAPGHWPRSVLCSDGLDGFQFFQLSRGSDRAGRTGHPNQKPLPLMRWLLDKLPPGGVVLDPFAGSGSTGLACLRTGRRFVGVEIDPGYAATARHRIVEDAPLFNAPTSPQPGLFDPPSAEVTP